MQTLATPRMGVQHINRILSDPAEPGGARLDQETGASPDIDTAELRNRLFRKLCFQPSWRKQVVLRRYDQAASGLTEARRATESLVRRIIDQSFAFEESGLPARNNPEVAQVMRDLLGDLYDFRLSVPSSIKSLELLGQRAEVIHDRLAAHLETSIDLFIDELFELFERMKQRHVLGRIRYGGEQGENCEFSYFRSKAVLKPSRAQAPTKGKTLSVQVGDPYLKDGEWWRTRTSAIRFLKTGCATIRHVRIKHLLSNVQTIPLDDWKLPLPERVVPVAAAIPDFLRPWASVVDGTLEYALMVEADITEAPYTYDSVECRDEEIRHDDPCLLLGSAVVAGWCPDEQPAVGISRRLTANLRHRFSARKGGGA